MYQIESKKSKNNFFSTNDLGSHWPLDNVMTRFLDLFLTPLHVFIFIFLKNWLRFFSRPNCRLTQPGWVFGKLRENSRKLYIILDESSVIFLLLFFLNIVTDNLSGNRFCQWKIVTKFLWNNFIDIFLQVILAWKLLLT